MELVIRTMDEEMDVGISWELSREFIEEDNLLQANCASLCWVDESMYHAPLCDHAQKISHVSKWQQQHNFTLWQKKRDGSVTVVDNLKEMIRYLDQLH